MPVKKGLAPKIRKMALDYPELSQAQIARQIGCTRGNVNTVLSTFLDGKTEQDLQDFQENRANILDSVAYRIVESIDEKKIQKASALQLVTAYGILHDKSALLRGQPTGINVTAVWDLVAALKAQQP